MRVTVCELNDAPGVFALEWELLVAHVKSEASELVLLPEMPFSQWFVVKERFEEEVWQQAVATHEAWLARLIELAPAVVVSSRPINEEGRRLNEGFVWDQTTGYRAAHHKSYLPNEDGFWEASWYDRGDVNFRAINCGALSIGFQICTDLWFMEHSRSYGQAGVHLIVNPRATERSTLDKWLLGGRVSAVIAGAFCLSSNRVSDAEQTVTFGGQGWIVGPNGDVLGLTSSERPFLTMEIALDEAERAKSTYPRYVLD
jgi:N-carbamoylputrescine amidase